MLRKLLKTDIPTILVIILIPLFIVGGSFIKDKVLLPMDMLSLYPPWTDVIENHKPGNPLLSDVVFQFYPWHKLAYDEAQATGQFPLWNPYELTGQPLVGNSQSSLYYPPNLLLHWIKPETVAVIRAYLNFLMLGIFTFYYCREIQLKRISSLFAAVIVMFAGPVIVWMQYPHINSLASFPLLLLSVEKIIKHRYLTPWIAALGVGIGLSVLGGHPETTFFICLATGLFFLIRLFAKRPGIKQGLIWSGELILGVFIGLLIGAIQLMPFMTSLLPSATLAQGGRGVGGGLLFYSGEWRYNLVTAVTYLIPNFFGSPSTGYYYWPFANYNNYNEQSVYFGLIPLALSLSVLFSHRKRAQAIALMIISTFYLAVAWRVPGFEVINHIPIFSSMANERVKLSISTMMAIVTGIGLNDWLEREQIGGLSIRERIVALIPPVITMLIFAIIGSIKIFFTSLNLSASKYGAILKNLADQIFTLNQPRTMVSLFVSVLFLLICILYWRKIIKPSLFATSVLLVTLIELVVLAWKYNPVVDKENVYPDIPLVSLVTQDSQPYRILSEHPSVFPPDAGAAYHIAQIEGYDFPISQSFFDLSYALGGFEAGYHQVWSVDYPLIDWLNIRYVISMKPIQKAGYRLVLDQTAYKVYQNENAYPRAYIVYDYQIIEDKKKLLSTMVSNPEILREKALFTQPPPELPDANLSSAVDQEASVEFINYGMDRVVLKASSMRSGFLVMSDIYAEGWKVIVDGRHVPLLNADYAFRAVYLPNGQHQVEFLYQPVSFVTGRILSICGISITLAGLGYFFLHNRLKSHKPEKAG